MIISYLETRLFGGDYLETQRHQASITCVLSHGPSVADPGLELHSHFLAITCHSIMFVFVNLCKISI